MKNLQADTLPVYFFLKFPPLKPKILTKALSEVKHPPRMNTLVNLNKLDQTFEKFRRHFFGKQHPGPTDLL